MGAGRECKYLGSRMGIDGIRGLLGGHRVLGPSGV